MVYDSIFLFLLSSLLTVSVQSAQEVIQSAQLTVMNGWQFQCANTTCSPFATSAALKIQDCQSACLSEVRCKAFTFRETAALCEIFTNVQSQASNMLAAVDVTTMIIMDRTRVPPEPTATITKSTSTSILTATSTSIPIVTSTISTSATTTANTYLSLFNTYRVYGVGSSPLAAVSNDFNQDNNLDLVVIGSQVNILLGYGDGTFGAPKAFAAGASPRFLASGDFNGDNKIDLAVVNSGGNTTSIFLGNGNGTFQTQQIYSTGSKPYSIMTSDLNGDGITDLVTGNALGNSTSIFIGYGNGSFQTQQLVLTGAGTQST
ncbi:unnamed protein product, partial [Adineta ricciae]